MSYFQKHLRVNSSNQNIQNYQMSKVTTSMANSYVGKFKKMGVSGVGRSKCDSIPQEDQGRKNRQEESKGYDSKYETNKNGNRKTRQEDLKQKGVGGGNGRSRGAVKGDECMNRSFHNLMLEADNSMQELLNSSINQFEKYLQDKDNIEIENHILQEQNQYLKASLDQLKIIIKDKLQSALKKQKEQLTTMLEDYIKLITKLLNDKSELTHSIQQLQQELKATRQQVEELQKREGQYTSKIAELVKQKDHHIAKTKAQIDDFLQIIEQYEEEAEQENQQCDGMKAKIEELEAQLAQQETPLGQGQLTAKISLQSSKIQTLLELLEKVQQQNKHLRENGRDHRAGQGMLEYYESRIEQLQREHEQEFMEYQKAIRETISKKDECIQRLTSIIEGLRNKKNSTKETSFQSSLQMIQEQQ